MITPQLHPDGSTTHTAPVLFAGLFPFTLVYKNFNQRTHINNGHLEETI